MAHEQALKPREETRRYVASAVAASNRAFVEDDVARDGVGAVFRMIQRMQPALQAKFLQKSKSKMDFLLRH